MIFDIEIDSEDDVLEIRAQVLKTLKEGGTTITSWSSENTSVTKVQNMSLQKILEETRLFLLLLNKKGLKRMSPVYF